MVVGGVLQQGGDGATAAVRRLLHAQAGAGARLRELHEPRVVPGARAPHCCESRRWADYLTI